MAKHVSSVAANSMLLIVSAMVLIAMLAGPVAAIRSMSEASGASSNTNNAERIDIASIAGVQLPEKGAVDAASHVDALQGCRDKYSNCVVWAQQGYCGVQYYFNGESVPFVACRASCGNC